MPCCRRSSRSTTCSAARCDRGALFDLPERDRALARAIVASRFGGAASSTTCSPRFSSAGCRESGTLYAILLSRAAQLIFLKTPPHAAIDLAVRLAQCDPRAKRYDKLVNAVLRRVASEGEAIAASLDAARVNTPDWLWDRWVTTWGEERRTQDRHRPSGRAAARPHGEEPIPMWAERLGARAADGQRAAAAQGPHRGLARLRRRRLVGAGRRRRAAGAPARRRRGQAGGRSLRRARRQDGAAGACRRLGDRGRRLERRGSSCSPPIWSGSGSTPSGAPPTPRPGSRRSASTPSCSMRPARPPARSAAIPTSPISRRPRTSRSWPPSRPGCSTTPASLLKPGGTLVYSTCSLEPEEGEAQVAALLARNPACRSIRSPRRGLRRHGWVKRGVLRTFPYDLQLASPEWSGMDGFFAARIKRTG